MTAAAVRSLAEITPGWITSLLRGHGHDAKVRALSSAPIGTGQVGATYRLSLDFAHNASNAPSTLVAKLPSDDQLSRAAGKNHMTYIRESRFYQLFAGKKPMAVPDHLYIAFDDESHDFTLIMQDLPHHVQGDQLGVPSLLEAQLAMDAAATIHAAWWGDPWLDTLDWLSGTRAVPPLLDADTLFTMFWPAFCDRYAERVTADMKRVGEAFLGRLGEWSAKRAGVRCLTHNDFRPDNMLYCADNPVKPIVIVDWQTVGVGSGAGDIAYYLGTAMDRETRRRHERALFERWIDGLIRHGVQGANNDALWNEFRAAAFSGFLMGVTASMVVGQTDRGDAMFLTMAERSAAMVLDHGAAAMPG